MLLVTDVLVVVCSVLSLQLTAKGLEVVYMVDALDEYLVQSLTEFDGTPLQAITKEGLDLGDKDKLTKQKEELKPLTDWLASVYGDRVKEVTVSNRIAKSPCVLVSGQYGSAHVTWFLLTVDTFDSVADLGASFFFFSAGRRTWSAS